MRIFHLAPRVAAAGAALLLAATAVQAQARLNTGYNYSTFAPYNPPALDQYWVNIGSYPSTPAGPAYVLGTGSPPWAPPFPLTHWLNDQNSPASLPGVSPQNPGYTIYRKCFCFLPNFKNPTLSFQLRADNNVQAWFNTITNVALPSGPGNFNGPPRQSLPSSPAWFRAGPNCLYVLVEDFGVLAGFDLVGTINAEGMMPVPATGLDMRFSCPCSGGPRMAMVADSMAADPTLQAIVRIAEERRRARTVAPER